MAVSKYCKQSLFIANKDEKSQHENFRETFPFSELHMKQFQQQQRFLNPVLKFLIHLFLLAPTRDISHLSVFGWLKNINKIRNKRTWHSVTLERTNSLVKFSLVLLFLM